MNFYQLYPNTFKLMKYIKSYESNEWDFEEDFEEDFIRYDKFLINSRKVDFNEIKKYYPLYAKKNFYIDGKIYLYKDKEYLIRYIIEESGKRGSLLHKNRKTVIDSELEIPIIRGRNYNELLDWQLRVYFYTK